MNFTIEQVERIRDAAQTLQREGGMVTGETAQLLAFNAPQIEAMCEFILDTYGHTITDRSSDGS